MSTAGQTNEKEFDTWWARTGEWVEEPNQRRGGTSGVQLLLPDTPEQPLLYSKRQIDHMFSSLRHPFGYPTAWRERNALQALERLGAKTPKLVFYSAVKKGKSWHALLVTEALTGFISLEQWYERQRTQPLEREHVSSVLQKIAHNFYRMHLGGWQHGCCYAKHVYIKADPQAAPEVAFLDLEKARQRWPAHRAALHDIKQFGRHREGMPDADWQVFLQHYCRLNPKLRSKLT